MIQKEKKKLNQVKKKYKATLFLFITALSAFKLNSSNEQTLSFDVRFIFIEFLAGKLALSKHASNIDMCTF